MQVLRFLSRWASSLLVQTFNSFVVIVTLLGALHGLAGSARAQGWFATSAWTNDASSGISPASQWAYHFGAATTATILGESVPGITGTNPAVAGQFAVSGTSIVYNADINYLTFAGGAGSAVVAHDFIYDGQPRTVTLLGLTTGQNYVATFLSVGFDAAPTNRLITFSDGVQSTVVNQDQFGQYYGIRVDYFFTATATTRVLTLSPQTATPNYTFHLFGLALRVIPIFNPSFEEDTFTNYPGYVDTNGGQISGWTLSNSNHIGLNPAGSSPFADNGAIPDGANVAFIQSLNTTSTLSTTIGGLTIGLPYAVTFRANCRAATGTPNPTWSLNGGAFVAFAAAPPVGGTKPYYTNTGYFTASSNTAALVLRNDTTVDTTVLVDAFSIGRAISLGTTNLVEGPGAGSDSLALTVPPGEGWAATVNAPWLHLSAANQSGTESTNVIFTFDANPGATRAGTLAFVGATLTVTQAGSNYVVANPVITLVSKVTDPGGLAVDGSGNVYASDTNDTASDINDTNQIQEWNADGTTVTTLVSSGLFEIPYVAVDGSGNVYIADTYNYAVKEWNAANNAVTTLVSGEIQPNGIAVDRFGNVYFADDYNFSAAILEWNAASNTVTSLVSSGLTGPGAVAVDGSGNVYFTDGEDATKEWNAANNTVTTLVSSGLTYPSGVAVDGSGNVYIADTYGNSIKRWNAASNTVTTLVSSGLKFPTGLAVDGSGTVYIADSGNNAIKARQRAYLVPLAKTEPGEGGADVLPTVLPATENLTGPFAPTSDQSWVTVTGVSNGVVSYAISANYGIVGRTSHLIVLGQSITISQSFVPPPPTLIGATMSANGVFQFNFTDTPYATFTVLSTTNLSLPLNQWTQLGAPIENPPGQYTFTDTHATNSPRFYTVRSP